MEKKKKNIIVLLAGNLLFLVFLFALITFAVITYFNNSLGWFAANKQVEGTGMSIEFDDVDAYVNYYAYIYDVKEAKVHYTGEGRVDTGNNNIDPAVDNLDVLFYDSIFKRRNRYTPAIIRMELYNMKYTSGTVNVTISRDTSVSTTKTTTSGNETRVTPSENFTSAMRFTLAQGKDWYTYQPETLPDDLYPRVDASLYNYCVGENASYGPASVSASNSEQYSFEKGNSEIFITEVTRNGQSITGIEKSSSITLSVPFDSEDLVNTAEGEALNIYLYLTYDESLIGNFSITGISGGSAVGQVIDLANDLTDMSISLSGN